MAKAHRPNRKLWAKIGPATRVMRKRATPAEDALWARLRNRSLDGANFRRQHPIDRFVVDFCCPELRLVIELDCGVHLRSNEEDRAREEALRKLGFRVVRFKNEDVLESPDAVMGAIAAAVEAEQGSQDAKD